MARKSRYNEYNTENQASVKEISIGEKTYNAAVYARLSNEDVRKKDKQNQVPSITSTIENQILLVRNYIESKPYLNLCGIYVDNGQTGTNFERGGFQSMMEAVKCGKIDCIVVKDLSRLGRDYIETGNYLEKVFPFLGVRFISINDGYDSYNSAGNGSNLTIILKNLMNDIYARDISKKIKSVAAMKHRKGAFSGNYAPYGYLKSPEDKNKFIVNEETAPIVRNMFKWKSEGMRTAAISRKLNTSGVLSPSNYLYFKGLLQNKKYAEKILWRVDSIKNILTNPAYIGYMAQGKKKSDLNLGLKCKKQPREKWIVIENTHEPIVEVSVFETVQKMLTESAFNAKSEADV